jgi:hypothetical protein
MIYALQLKSRNDKHIAYKANDALYLFRLGLYFIITGTRKRQEESANGARYKKARKAKHTITTTQTYLFIL